MQVKIDTKMRPTEGKAALNFKEEKFIEGFITHGSATLAAEEAGYARSYASALTKRLSPFIEKNVRQIIGRNAPLALVTIMRVMETTEDDKVRLLAAQDILDRAGYNQIQKHELSIGDKTEEEIDKELSSLLGKANIIDVTPT